MTTQGEIFNKLRELKPMLRHEYAVKQIGVFGSISEGSFSDESDIDILVELERPIGWKFFSLELYLEQVFKRRIDLVTENALKEEVKDKILARVKYV